MIDTLALWRGEFGNSYTERNAPTVEQVLPVFEKMLDGIYFSSVLEVGCNRGHNLQALSSLAVGQRIAYRGPFTGIEPNAIARAAAIADDLFVLDGDVRDLVFSDDSYDLVLSCGLLIHIAPEDVQQAISELVRVAYRYLLVIEYAAPKEEMARYRDLDDILWKRPYGEMIETHGPKIIRHEDECSELYPGCEWWLFETA